MQTTDDSARQDIEKLREKAPIPTIWLFGKTQSGKSSVVRYLTTASDVAIGDGFRPVTKTSRRYDFPDRLEPLCSFVDTRGLGEAQYDPAEDMQRFDATSQVMVVTVRVGDHALEGLISPLRKIRNANPKRPVLLALTCLHTVLSGYDISAGPDPFTAGEAISQDLQTLIDEKILQFTGLYDILIPIDFTQSDDGFADPNFGGKRLRSAILQYMPHAYRQSLNALDDDKRPLDTALQKKVRRQVLASSALAATAGAVPLPWLDIPAVLSIQTHMAYRIADIYDLKITPANWAAFSSAVGTRAAVSLGVRELLKFIPILGIAAGAASSFAFTYALGMSWDWYFADVRGGGVPSPELLKEFFAEQLKRGRQLWDLDSR